MTIQTKIGNRIRELRNLKGLSQEKLGFNSNVDRTYINSVEHGRRNISAVTLEKILAALDISFKEFFSIETFA